MIYLNSKKKKRLKETKSDHQMVSAGRTLLTLKVTALISASSGFSWPLTHSILRVVILKRKKGQPVRTGHCTTYREI